MLFIHKCVQKIKIHKAFYSSIVFKTKDNEKNMKITDFIF